MKTLLLLGLLLYPRAYAAEPTYFYQLEMEETKVAKRERNRVTLIPVDEERPVKRYSCEVTVTIEPDTTVYGGSFFASPVTTYWKFTSRQRINFSDNCRDSRVQVVQNSYVEGTYEEKYSTTSPTKPAPEPKPARQFCVMVADTINRIKQKRIPERIRNCTSPFNPNATLNFHSTRHASFLRVDEADHSGLLTTPQYLKLKDGKISGYSDEVLFSGSYKLNSP